MWLANPHSILRGGFSLSRAKAVFIPPAKLVVVARSSYPTEKQKLPHKNTVRQLLLFICCAPACTDSSIPPYSAPAEGRFCPPYLWPQCCPAFPGMAACFAERSYYTREKSIKTLLRPFIPPFLTDFTMFFMKKALQMNFKNILYNYKLSFFMQTFSYQFVWGRQACAFRTASALR